MCSMVPWSTLNFNLTFPMHQRFFIMDFYLFIFFIILNKFFTLRSNSSLKNCSWKGSLCNQKMFFYGTFNFKSVASQIDFLQAMWEGHLHM